MTETMTAPPGLLRTLTQRPGTSMRATAKTISKVRPEVIVPTAADPAVLVRLPSDLRLSLTQLAAETNTTLASSYVVSRLATGCVDLDPYDPDHGDPDDRASDDSAASDGSDDAAEIPPKFLTMRVDGRSRLVLSRGVAHRLAVSAGAKVLVTLSPDTQSLRVLNLATLADAVEACLAVAAENEEVTS